MEFCKHLILFYMSVAFHTINRYHMIHTRIRSKYLCSAYIIWESKVNSWDQVWLYMFLLLLSQMCACCSSYIYICEHVYTDVFRGQKHMIGYSTVVQYFSYKGRVSWWCLKLLNLGSLVSLLIPGTLCLHLPRATVSAQLLYVFVRPELYFLNLNCLHLTHWKRLASTDAAPNC